MHESALSFRSCTRLCTSRVESKFTSNSRRQQCILLKLRMTSLKVFFFFSDQQKSVNKWYMYDDIMKQWQKDGNNIIQQWYTINHVCLRIYIIIITIHYTRANERNKCFTKKQWKMRIKSACELSLILVTRLKWLCFISLFLLYTFSNEWKFNSYI